MACYCPSFPQQLHIPDDAVVDASHFTDLQITGLKISHLQIIKKVVHCNKCLIFRTWIAILMLKKL